MKRILIVEDSILMQRVIGDIISSSSEFEVCGFARDVVEGWAKFNRLEPDAVTLDYELPGDNGLVLLKKIMDAAPKPVLMLSAHTRDGADLTIRSLEMGAIDFFTKPSGPISIDLYNYKEDLIKKLRATCNARLNGVITKKTPVSITAKTVMYLGIAASTGGVRALNYLIPCLSETSGLAIFIVQHMPKFFTTSLAHHLNERSSMLVKEACHGDPVRPGEVLVAPGGYHTEIDVTGTKLKLNKEPARHGVRPSADILFESMARAFREQTIGIILTGMGRDGAAGIVKIKEKNGIVIVQDPDDAVIGGMPQAALNTGMVDFTVPLQSIPDRICEFIARGQT
jgi:two-component system chemotaxis response regulator CheB